MGPSELWTGQGFSSWMTFIKFILRLSGVGHHLYRGPEVSTSYSAAYWSLTWLRDSAQESQQSHLWHPNTSKLCKGEAAWLRTGLECLRVGDVFVHGDWCLCVFVPSIQLVYSDCSIPMWELLQWHVLFSMVLPLCWAWNGMNNISLCCPPRHHSGPWLAGETISFAQKVSGFRWPVGGGRSSQIYLTQGPAFLQSW